MSRRLKDDEKTLYLMIAKYKATGKSVPNFANLSVMVAKQYGREVVDNSGATSARVSKLQAAGFLRHEKYDKSIRLSVVPDAYRDQFSDIEHQLIEAAIRKQNGIVHNEFLNGYHTFGKSATNTLVKRYDSVAYSQYVRDLLVDARRMVEFPDGGNQYADARFQLAINCFQDWEHLKKLESDVVFPPSFTTTTQDIVNGLVWLNDAVAFGHDEVADYIDRLVGEIIPKVIKEDFDDQQFLDLIKKFEFQNLVALIGSKNEMKCLS